MERDDGVCTAEPTALKKIRLDGTIRVLTIDQEQVNRIYNAPLLYITGVAVKRHNFLYVYVRHFPQSIKHCRR